MLNFIINTIAVPFLIVLVGIICNCIVQVICEFLSMFLPSSFIYLFLNYLTFPGTICHELAHGLTITILGGKVTEWNLFKPQGNSLGSIVFYTRGSYLMKCLQNSLGSIAPIPVNLCLIQLLYLKALDFKETMGWRVFIIYLMISLFIHLDLSSADIKGIFQGLPAVLLLSAIFVYFSHFSIFNYLPIS